MYECSLRDSFNGLSNWVQNVKSLFDTYGFSNTFTSYHSVNVKSFLHDFKERVLDSFITDLFRSANTSTVLDMYKYLKTSFEYEYYLNVIPKSYRLYFKRLRKSSLHLRIQTGRHGRNSIPCQLHYCQCCGENDIEDEFYFICVCKSFYCIEKKVYQILQLLTSIYKCHSLLCSRDIFELINLCNFIKEASTLRNSILNIIL